MYRIFLFSISSVKSLSNYDDKWILQVNPELRNSCVNPGAPSKSVTQPNLFGKKVLLVFGGISRPCFIMSCLNYGHQLIRLSPELERKRSYSGKGVRLLKLLNDSPRLHFASKTEHTILNLGWEILQHPEYLADIALSDRCNTPCTIPHSENSLTTLSCPKRQLFSEMELINCLNDGLKL